MAHKNYSVLSRPAIVTPKKKFFFFTHRRRRRSNTPARSARSASQQSRVIAAVHILLLLLYTAKDISPSALQRKRLPFYFGRPLFVRDLASHFHLIPQANTSSFYSSLVTRRGGRSSRSSFRPFYSSRGCAVNRRAQNAIPSGLSISLSLSPLALTLCLISFLDRLTFSSPSSYLWFAVK
jgi:hypothetical protein